MNGWLLFLMFILLQKKQQNKTKQNKTQIRWYLYAAVATTRFCVWRIAEADFEARLFARTVALHSFVN